MNVNLYLSKQESTMGAGFVFNKTYQGRGTASESAGAFGPSVFKLCRAAMSSLCNLKSERSGCF